MTKEINELKMDLLKKEQEFSDKLAKYFENVVSAHATVFNDKQDWQVVRLERRKQQVGVHRMFDDMFNKKWAVKDAEESQARMTTDPSDTPIAIQNLIQSRELIKWHGYPNSFPVSGVDYAYIQWDGDKLTYHLVEKISNRVQLNTYMSLVNKLNMEIWREQGRENQ